MQERTLSAECAGWGLRGGRGRLCLNGGSRRAPVCSRLVHWLEWFSLSAAETCSHTLKTHPLTDWHSTTQQALRSSRPSACVRGPWIRARVTPADPDFRVCWGVRGLRLGTCSAKAAASSKTHRHNRGVRVRSLAMWLLLIGLLTTVHVSDAITGIFWQIFAFIMTSCLNLKAKPDSFYRNNYWWIMDWY